MIIDVVGLCIVDLKGLELIVNDILGVVIVGLFVKCGVNVLLLGIEVGV